MSKTAVIISISSDIGTALAKRWLAKGWTLAGTYRSESDAVAGLREKGAAMMACDLSRADGIAAVVSQLSTFAWDVLVIAPATLEALGCFEDIDFVFWFYYYNSIS